MRSRLACSWIAALLFSTIVFAQDASVPVVDTEILWDFWGVPHIFAQDTASLFYAFGWAQMHNHADLILQLYGRARGEAAQYWGADFLQSDILIHTLGVPEVGAAHYAAQNPDFKRYIDAFVAGMNAYVEANPDAIAAEMEAVLPIRETDPLTLAYSDVTINFVAESAFGMVRAWSPGQLGSNAWAIAPARSASGNALLVANPHLPWSDLFTMFEAHLIAPEINLYGATLVGLPGILVGFNEHLGWTHTVNMYDGFDLYELSLTDTGGYLLDGAEQAFEVDTKTIRVAQEDGTSAEHTFEILRSIHGPVITSISDGRALAFRVVDGSTHMMEQWWQMGTSTTLADFEDAMARLQIPMFNTVYADVDGHIYYLFNGQIPVREHGDYAEWLSIQPGDDSSRIWTTYHPYEDLPKVIDPATGFLQSANEVPWTSTIPPVLDMADFPPYFAPQQYWVNHIFRSITSQQMLVEDLSITFDEAVAYKHSTHVEVADHVLDSLIAAARASENALVQEAAEVLANWNRNTDADSRGAVLFTRWFQTYTQQAGFDIFEVPFDIAVPFDTPYGLSDPSHAVTVLTDVAEQIRLEYGSLDVAYGDVMRLRIGDYDLPGNGGGDPNGVFRTAWYVPDGTGTYNIVGGDAWIGIIEFADPLRASVLLGPGNATQPDSPHRGDQLGLFAANELRDAWLTHETIEANLELREVIEIPES